MVWISCDRRRGTGGDLMTAEGWMVMNPETLQNQKNTSAEGSTKEDRTTKDPNHKENGTVNIFNPANAGIHPVTVHYDLIQFFNGKRVIN